jgi:LysM repeat protein
MAVAGVLVAVPQAHAAVKSPAKATTVAGRVHTDALVQHTQAASRTYTVRPGDTLSQIAQRFYGNPADWTWLYHVNQATVSNPNEIYVGETLQVPYDPPANAASYTPKHAQGTMLSSSATTLSSSATTPSSSATTPSGPRGCSGLEALWDAAGGSPAEAFMAAEIAMAESGGEQDAVSPTNDYGYWQINGSHGPALATFDPIGNAQAAITISDDGRDWDPWTTYVTGAYEGRC